MGFSSFFRYKNMKYIGRMAIVGPIYPPSLDDDPGALDGLAGEGEVADQGGVPVPTALQLGWFSRADTHTLLLIIETFQCLLLAWLAKHSMAEAEGKPVNNLNARNETEAEEESQQTANLGNEIYWGHSQRSLELKHCRFLGKTLI